jgi:hypothetical protein
VYYAPFEWVNPEAKVVLVGITPGRVQAHNALAEAKRCLQSKMSIDEALRMAKLTGAFSGKMRPNLVDLLDTIGLNEWLRIQSCNELFTTQTSLLQTSSVLQFPVFISGENYNGTPDPTKIPLLRRMLIEHFAKMTQILPDAVYVALGPVPAKAMAWLVENGHMSGKRVLSGLPHPSPANAERIAYFLGRKPKDKLSKKTDPAKLDAARLALQRTVSGLR